MADNIRCRLAAVRTALASLALLSVAGSIARAETAAPGLATMQAMSIALVSRGAGDCPIDSAPLYDALTAIAHGHGFPAITTASEDPDAPSLLVIVSATPEAKTPGFNPAVKDRQATCLVMGSAMLLREGAGVEATPSERIMWQASMDAARAGLSPGGVNGQAELIVRDLAKQFGAEWRQSQE